jgi:hypothetical protein
MVAPSNKRFLLESDKGVANGLATLGADAKIPDAQLPTRLGDTALNATFVPKWKPTTAYLAGDAVLSPTGDTVTAKANFTSGASYSAANWDLSANLAGKLDKTEAAITYGRSLDLRTKGAVAGTTDSSAAFLAAMTDAKNSSATVPFSVASDPHASVVIDLPAGVFTVTQLNGMIGAEAKASKTAGLKIRGAGLGLTSVIFNPASAGALNFNDYWLSIAFEGIDFYATIAGCTFLQSYTTHNAQRYSFERCTWKNFKYVIDLQGNNNNSEFYFAYCHSDATGQKETVKSQGAFFYIGTTNTSDQFLNYWFYGCTHWNTSTPFIDAAKGGHFHIFGLDASNWGGDLTAAGYLFALRGTTHSQGVQSFNANGVRVEAKNANAALLFSEWSGGTVTFRNADWSSQVGSYTYGDIIKIAYVNVDGSIYSFEDCVLAGGVGISFSTNDWQHVHSLTFTNCRWMQRTSPSDVVGYTVPGSNPWNLPAVAFVRCRGGNSDVTAAAGATVWDAVIGYRGDMMQTLQLRTVSVRDIYGVPGGSNSVTVQLPVGALITGMEVMGPAGGVGDTNTTGYWTLKTTEATPTVIATANLTTAPNLGYDVNVSLAAPFLCDSTTKATVKVTPTNVNASNTKGLLLIKGYW